MKGKATGLFVMFVLLLMALFGASAVSGQQIVPETVSGNTRVEWQPQIAYESAVLTVSGPDGYTFQRTFPASVVPFFQTITDDGSLLAAGSYTYEIQLTPALSAETKAELSAAANDSSRQALVSELTANGFLPEPSQLMLSGYLTVESGRFLPSAAVEVIQPGFDSGSNDEIAYPNDQVVLDDYIIDGSLCVGMDCVNGESFGFDTIRLKENNIRIRAFDTSSTASFPSVDWQITFNDSTNGGANKFSIDDIDNGRTPFTIEAGAPSHSLYVDDGGRLGLGTSTPVVEIHTKDGDTPTLRLDQDGSSGWSPQIWDVAGNEAGFFIRDVTNGSALPFRILPGAASASLVIDGNEDVGIGAGTNPEAPLHVRRTNGTANVLVEESSGTVLDRTLLNLENNGGPTIQYSNTNSGVNWRSGIYSFGGDNFAITRLGTGGVEFQISPSGEVTMGPGASTVFTLTPTGNLTISGTLSDASSRDLKENFVETDGSILEMVLDLPIYFYNYLTDDDSIKHIGPTAEDFAEVFDVGADDKHISPRDLASVALAAVQELHETIKVKDAEIQTMQVELREQQALIEALEAKNADLEERLAALEAIVLGQLEENE
jgi:hypothetical protein